MIAEGKLGKIYHVRSVGHRRQGRPGYDMPFFSHDFISPAVGVHRPLFDLGIYHLAQMLYVLGMPELESVYGFQSCDYGHIIRELGEPALELEGFSGPGFSDVSLTGKKTAWLRI